MLSTEICVGKLYNTVVLLLRHQQFQWGIGWRVTIEVDSNKKWTGITGWQNIIKWGWGSRLLVEGLEDTFQYVKTRIVYYILNIDTSFHDLLVLCMCTNIAGIQWVSIWRSPSSPHCTAQVDIPLGLPDKCSKCGAVGQGGQLLCEEFFHQHA